MKASSQRNASWLAPKTVAAASAAITSQRSEGDAKRGAIGPDEGTARSSGGDAGRATTSPATGRRERGRYSLPMRTRRPGDEKA